MNNLPQVKRDLIAGLDARRSQARAFVEKLPPDLPVHADSDWTIRDLIIHLTAIEADMIKALHCAIDGTDFQVDLLGQPSVPDLYELRRTDRAGVSWHDLLTEWDHVRDQLRGVILAFPLALIEKQFSNPFFQDYNLIEARHLAEMRSAAERDR